MSTTPHDEGAAQPRRLYPASLAFLMEERNLLWYEKASEYDSLRGEILDYLQPADPIECIFAKNVVDYFWEHRRWKRQMHTAINYAMPQAAGDILAPAISLLHDAEHARVVTQARRVAFDGSDECDAKDKNLEDLMERACVTPEMLHFKAAARLEERIDRIRRECDHIEARIHWLIKNFEARRAAIAARAKSLLEREAAQTVEYREAD